MDRLNQAAASKVGSMIAAYNRAIAQDVAELSGAEEGEVMKHLEHLADVFFVQGGLSARFSSCAWYTKRGEPCHKERRPGSDYCSVHAEYFKLHSEEISRAKTCPEHVNVTRKGIHKGMPPKLPGSACC